jgi:3-oxoacyl-[acyl-carrier-protein] synthase-1
MAQQQLYIAGIGMVTAVGGNAEMTAAAVKANMSAYELSDFDSACGEPIKMALVPDEIFDEIEVETNLTLAEGDRYKARHDRISIMAMISMQETCNGIQSDKSVPLLMAKSEYGYDQTDLSSLTDNIAGNVTLWKSGDISRSIYSGRAAGIEAIGLIFDYLYDGDHDYFIVGGSDSYFDNELINQLADNGRLLYSSNPDGFAPGEAAGYLVLTRKPELALVKNGQMIALSPPGIADEVGHLNSDLPYKGEGLDEAFKKALSRSKNNGVSTIYSSMNGEHFWAKELGVAQLRNKAAFCEQVEIIHPAENFGDIGAATGPVLLALAADNLWQDEQANSSLVYGSADNARRGAIVIEKVLAKTITASTDNTRNLV